MSWFRAFDGLNMFTFMPTAIVYTRLLRYHMDAAENFLWMVKWWSHLGGWVTSAGNMTIGALAMYADLKNGIVEDVTCTQTRRRRRYTTTCVTTEEEDDTYAGGLTFGITIIVSELIGWGCYYVWRKGAYRYADNLMQSYANIVEF